MEICICCGGKSFTSQTILWEDLITQWNLAPNEVEYINRQQGTACTSCGNNLRSMALARAILSAYGYKQTFKQFVTEDFAHDLKVAELNTAGQLTQFLSQLPHHTLRSYPDFDMMQMQEPDESYDLIIHSDTLEHIEHPIRGLSECRRIVKSGGFCAFTIPLIVGRLSRSRAGAPDSFHGSSENPQDCLVRSEYGADAWGEIFQAGFSECRITSIDYPTAQAFVCVR